MRDLQIRSIIAAALAERSSMVQRGFHRVPIGSGEADAAATHPAPAVPPTPGGLELRPEVGDERIVPGGRRSTVGETSRNLSGQTAFAFRFLLSRLSLHVARSGPFCETDDRCNLLRVTT